MLKVSLKERASVHGREVFKMTKEMINKMIFDLQRFVDPEIYLSTAANETVGA